MEKIFCGFWLLIYKKREYAQDTLRSIRALERLSQLRDKEMPKENNVAKDRLRCFQ